MAMRLCILLLLTVLSATKLLIAQSNILCVNNPVGNYYVIGSTGSTYVWDTEGNGTIIDQGKDSITVIWNAIPGLYTLSVIETSEFGCDGTPQFLTVEILAYAPVIQDTICQGENYTLPDGTVVDANGTYVVMLTSVGGCDSVITTNLTVLDAFDETVDVDICTGQDYTLPDGTIVDATGTYMVTFTSVGGCDSVITTNLTVNDTFDETVDVDICAGQDYTLPDGTVVDASGTYVVTLSSTGGCDSVITTNLTINDTFDETVDVDICAGQDYTLPDGTVVDASGTYVVTLSSTGGCDSVITTNLTINDTFDETVDVDICAGQDYTLPDGTVVDASGTYVVTLTSVGGCDSVITTNLTVNDAFEETVDVDICAGQDYILPDGTVVDASGTYVVTLSSVGGCDSIITTNLTVNDSFDETVDADICSGQDYTLPDGTVVDASGTYVVTLTSVGGCDSVITTNLTVNDAFEETVDVDICAGQDYILPDGTVVDASGTYVVTLSSVGGCDSIITTNLTVNDSFDETVDADICSGQDYTLPDGTVVDAGGTYVVTLSSTDGCDSVITTNLTVIDAFEETVDVDICAGQDYILPDGTVVDASGTYVVTLSSVGGCDSIITTNLTVNDSFDETVDADICSGQDYTLPDGTVVDASGTYVVTLTSVGGCDSVVTTNLTVNDTFDETVDVDICLGQDYTLPDGTVVDASGTYVVTLSSVGGCDSVFTTNLTVNDAFEETVDVDICAGQEYTLPDGTVVDASGTYVVTLTSVGGCDSIITTNLTINDILSSDVVASICEGQVYTLPDGSQVSDAGTYTVTLSSAGGCDSIVTTDLSINPVFSSSFDIEICDGESYTLPDGTVVSTAGTYVITLFSTPGCDSIITTNLTVNDSFDETVDADICSGQDYTLPDGTVVDAGGTYVVTLSSTDGCDSVITTNLTVIDAFDETVDVDICAGQDYSLPDGTVVDASGTYVVTLSSVGGCDSVITTNLTVIDAFDETVDVDICAGQEYTLPDGTVVDASGTYVVTLTSVGGCDSIITTNLTINDILSSDVVASICEGQVYTLPDGSQVSDAGTYTVTLSSAGGCDSIVTTDLSINPVFSSSFDIEICDGESYTLPDGTVVSTAGTYVITLFSTPGCDSVITTNLALKATPFVNLGGDRQFCDGDSVVLDAGNPGSIYQWNTGQTSQQIVAKDQGDYVVAVSNNGCTSKDSVRVTVQPNFTTSLGPDLILCEGGSVVLDPQISGADFQWNTGETTPTITVTESGSYAVLITQGNCTNLYQVDVDFSLQAPVIQLRNDTLLCDGDVILLTVNGEDTYSYTWQDGSTEITYTVSQPGTYFVTASNECGTATASTFIDYENCNCGVYVPNAFTPNDDGVNDKLTPIATCEVSNYVFKVFNRWNEMVFETDELNVGWDGYYQGAPQSVDSYIFYVSYLDGRWGNTVVLKGYANLLR